MIARFLRHLLSLIEGKPTMTDTPAVTVAAPRALGDISTELTAAKTAHAAARDALAAATATEKTAASAVHGLAAELKAAVAAIESDVGGIVTAVETKVEAGMAEVEKVL